MSFSICRIAKIKASGVTGIQIHDRREKGVSHTNEDIDWNKTSENIDLLEQQERFRTVAKNRIDELKLPRALRKDATVMTQCLITSDSAFFEKMNKHKQIEFFEKSFDFIKERYGEKNLVSAIIHFDEQTPHMHVNFVPVTHDGRLSARDLFSPKQLRELQNDFNKHCNDNGYDLERGKIDSKRKHLSVEEYKLETKFTEINKKIKGIESERDAVKSGLNSLRGDFDKVKGVKALFGEIDAIKSKQGLLGKTTISTKDFNKLKDLSKKQYAYEHKIKKLSDENKKLNNDISCLKKSDMKDFNENYGLKKDLKDYEKKLGKVVEYLENTNQTNKFKDFMKDKDKTIIKGLEFTR